jgi:fatty acid desaturase
MPSATATQRKGKEVSPEDTATASKRSSVSFTQLRKDVARITAEELAKEPKYYRLICNLTGLRRAQDCKTLLWMGIYFGSGFLLWNWAKWMPAHIADNWFIWAAVYYVNIFWSFLGAVITHNTMHQAMFYSTFMNRVIQVLLTLSYGHPVSSYVPGHNLSHHKYTQSRKDVMNTHLLQHKSHLMNLLLFSPTVTWSVLQSDLRYILYQQYNGNVAGIRQALRELLAHTVVQFACLFMSPWKFLLYFHIPHACAQYGIVTLNMLQHDGCEEFIPDTEEVNFNTSRNFVNYWVNFFCLNNGYHTIHHLAPTSHWSLGKALHEQLIIPNIDQRLVCPSMAQFVYDNYVANGNPWNKESRRLDYRNREIQVRPREDESRITYEEWLNFPKDFDTSKLPSSTSELIPAIFLLTFKYAVSPLYSFDPNVKGFA